MIVNYKFLLGDPVQQLRVQHPLGLKSSVENPEASAHHHFRRRTPATNAPRNPNPRRPVAVIMNFILRLKAQSVAQSKVRPHAPVVLQVKPRIVGGDCGLRVSRRVSELRRKWRSSAGKSLHCRPVRDGTRYWAAGRSSVRIQRAIEG